MAKVHCLGKVKSTENRRPHRAQQKSHVCIWTVSTLFGTFSQHLVFCSLTFARMWKDFSRKRGTYVFRKLTSMGFHYLCHLLWNQLSNPKLELLIIDTMMHFVKEVMKRGYFWCHLVILPLFLMKSYFWLQLFSWRERTFIYRIRRRRSLHFQPFLAHHST